MIEVSDCSGIQPPPSLLPFPCPEEHGAEHEQDDDDDDEYFAHDLRNRHPRFECLEPDVVMAEQPVVKVQLHSTGAASRLPTLLLGQILPVGAEGHGKWPILSKQRSGYRQGAAEGSAARPTGAPPGRERLSGCKRS